MNKWIGQCIYLNVQPSEIKKMTYDDLAYYDEVFQSMSKAWKGSSGA